MQAAELDVLKFIDDFVRLNIQTSKTKSTHNEKQQRKLSLPKTVLTHLSK